MGAPRQLTRQRLDVLHVVPCGAGAAHVRQERLVRTQAHPAAHPGDLLGRDRLGVEVELRRTNHLDALIGELVHVHGLPAHLLTPYQEIVRTPAHRAAGVEIVPAQDDADGRDAPPPGFIQDEVVQPVVSRRRHQHERRGYPVECRADLCPARPVQRVELPEPSSRRRPARRQGGEGPGDHVLRRAAAAELQVLEAPVRVLQGEAGEVHALQRPVQWGDPSQGGDTVRARPGGDREVLVAGTARVGEMGLHIGRHESHLALVASLQLADQPRRKEVAEGERKGRGREDAAISHAPPLGRRAARETPRAAGADGTPATRPSLPARGCRRRRSRPPVARAPIAPAQLTSWGVSPTTSTPPGATPQPRAAARSSAARAIVFRSASGSENAPSLRNSERP